MRAEELQVCKINEFATLRAQLEQNAELILAYTKTHHGGGYMIRGYAIFALSVVLAGKLPTEEDTMRMLEQLHIWEDARQEVCDEVRKINEAAAQSHLPKT
jgi:hypothetical protein